MTIEKLDTAVTDAIERLGRQLAAAHPNHKTMVVYIGDLRAALNALSARPASPLVGGEAEPATENEPLSVTEVMQRCTDQCNRMEKRGQATFSIKGIRMLLAEITELRRNLRHWREECGKLHAAQHDGQPDEQQEWHDYDPDC